MREDLDKALVKDFPVLYQNRHKSMESTAMCWGFQCGDGWESIIRQISVNLEALNKFLPNNDPIIASTVKEKYGTLRFYVHSVPHTLGNIVDLIIATGEQQSARTCEQCGKKGKLRGKVWLMTRCLKCWRAYENKVR